jgi:nitrate reductase gamma subunit
MVDVASIVSAFIVEKLPYVTLAVFIAGMGLRLSRWMRAPKGNRETRIDIPSSIKYVILDTLFLRKQFKTDKVTWALVFSLHASLAGIIVGHLRGFNWWSASIFDALGPGAATFVVRELPVYVGWVFLGSLVLLLLRRIHLEKRRLLSFPNDYAVMLLLLVIAVAGQAMRILPAEVAPANSYDVVFIPGLVVLHLETIPSTFWFLTHTLAAQLFIMYIPFSKLIHIWSGVLTSALYGSRRKMYDN